MPDDSTERERPARELRDILAGLRSRAWVFAVSVLVVAGLAYLIAGSHAKTYTASAVLLFDDTGQIEQSVLGASTGDQATAQQQTSTDHDLASLPIIAQRTAALVGHGLTAQQVSDRVSIPTGDGGDTADVQATGPTAAGAQQLANAFAAATIAYRRKVSLAAIIAARGSLDREIGEASQNPSPYLRNIALGTLDRDVLRIRVMASVDDGGIELAQPALRPSSPTAPLPAHDALIGAFGGLLLGLVLALALDQHDDRLRDGGHLGASLGLPLLAAIPAQRRPRRRSGATSASLELRESMRRLHARLRHGRRAPEARSVLVTSPAPGSGKTTVAWHLASAAAEAGERVLLLEADLRKPDLAAMLGDPGAVGLTELLRTPGADVGEFVHHVRLPPSWLGDTGRSDGQQDPSERHDGPDRARLLNMAQTRLREAPLADGDWSARRGFGLDILFGGSANGEAYALLASQAMSRALRELVSKYDRVIVDSPPTALFSDGMPLMKQVDGVIIVLRVGHDTSTGARRLATELRGIGVDPLGVVLNDSSAESPGAKSYPRARLPAEPAHDADRPVPAVTP
jgi:polysaccharide biosynthesis transport protein